MDPVVEDILTAILEGVGGLEARLASLEARFEEHTSVSYTTYSDWKRIEQAHCVALANASAARNEVAEVRGVLDGVVELLELLEIKK